MMKKIKAEAKVKSEPSSNPTVRTNSKATTKVRSASRATSVVKPKSQGKASRNSKTKRQKSSMKRSRNSRFFSFSLPQKILIIAAACGLFLYFIYQPVCMWYAAARDGQILQEEKALYEQSIAEHQARVDTLKSDEGIKNEAREHGYAEKGESTVMVEGLPSDKEQADASDANPIPKEIEQAVLDEPDPFYIQIFDFIFLYHKG